MLIRGAAARITVFTNLEGLKRNVQRVTPNLPVKIFIYIYYYYYLFHFISFLKLMFAPICFTTGNSRSKNPDLQLQSSPDKHSPG